MVGAGLELAALPSAAFWSCALTTTATELTSNAIVKLFILLLIGALPTWPYSAGWGYYPTGGLGLLLLIVLMLVLFRLV